MQLSIGISPNTLHIVQKAAMIIRSSSKKIGMVQEAVRLFKTDKDFLWVNGQRKIHGNCVLSHTLTWKQKFNKIHDVNIMIGQEYVASNSESNEMIGKFFQEDITPEKMFASMAANSGATGSRTISSQLGQEDRTISFFGRANYSLMDRYLLTFTIRADGSSKFTKGNRWGYFPAAAFAWRIIEEPFMEPVKEFMSNLKLRLSYGTAGNNRIGNSLYETSYKAYSSGKYYGAGGEQNPHYTLNNEQLANPDLKWETTITRNIGFRLRFLQ